SSLPAPWIGRRGTVQVVKRTDLLKARGQVDEDDLALDEAPELADLDVGDVRPAGAGLAGDHHLVVHLVVRQDHPVDVEVRLLARLIQRPGFLLPPGAGVAEGP